MKRISVMPSNDHKRARRARAVGLAVLALMAFLLAGCLANRGEIVWADDGQGHRVAWYVAPPGSGDLPDAAALDRQPGTVYVHEGRIGVRIQLNEISTTDGNK